MEQHVKKGLYKQVAYILAEFPDGLKHVNPPKGHGIILRVPIVL